jgi:DHA2 family multidrug resistance protein
MATALVGHDHHRRADPRADPGRDPLRQCRLALGIFWINVPVGDLQLVRLAAAAPHETPWPGQGRLVGLGLLIVWVGALQVMLDWARTHDWFASVEVNVLLIIALVAFVAFCIWEWTEEHPIVDIRVFKNISLSISTVTMALVFGVYFASGVIIPLWLQTNLGYTATWAGYATAFNGVLAVMIAPVIGRMVGSGKFDPRALVSFGLCGLTVIMLWRTTFTMDMSFWQVSMPQLVQGLFMPLFFLPLMTVALGTIPMKDLANGAAMITFVRTVAGAVMTSIMTTTWDDSATRAHANLVGDLHPEALGPAAAGHVTATLERLVQSQAVMIATNHIFALVAVAMAISAIAIWFAPKPQRIGGGGGGGH